MGDETVGDEDGRVPGLLVSPTEPTQVRALGTTSWISEEWGADAVLVTGDGRTVGVQRKQFPGDFLSAVGDDRLGTQVRQMAGLDIAAFVLEGRGEWSVDGRLIQGRGRKQVTTRWERSHVWNLLLSIQESGVKVMWTDDVGGTCEFIRGFARWAEKPEHTSLLKVSGPPQPQFGKLENRDYQMWLVQHLPGAGVEKARSLVDHLPRFMFRLDVTREELLEVPGVGKTWVEKIMKLFGETGQQEDEKEEGEHHE